MRRDTHHSSSSDAPEVGGIQEAACQMLLFVATVVLMAGLDGQERGFVDEG